MEPGDEARSGPDVGGAAALLARMDGATEADGAAVTTVVAAATEPKLTLAPEKFGTLEMLKSPLGSILNTYFWQPLASWVHMSRNG